MGWDSHVDHHGAAFTALVVGELAVVDIDIAQGDLQGPAAFLTVRTVRVIFNERTGQYVRPGGVHRDAGATTRLVVHDRAIAIFGRATAPYDADLTIEKLGRDIALVATDIRADRTGLFYLELMLLAVPAGLYLYGRLPTRSSPMTHSSH